ncbi:hypothetical protein Ccrd_024525 [Cynara cardunculus var. scolymus]|uniref:Uncharacterized protein n=1 Tax=Cynara cardunculus var. scolymus TaxID=59895 RepID=A0A118JRS4_CYNCS|nr:hypothetical protein Ccrd_024525 [Cynara cardunculus var. scolymus]
METISILEEEIDSNDSHDVLLLLLKLGFKFDLSLTLCKFITLCFTFEVDFSAIKIHNFLTITDSSFI